MKLVAVIPVYRHAASAQDVAAALIKQQIPVILVDDGNNESDMCLLKKLIETLPEVILLRLNRNQGKGAAVMHGMRYAYSHGYTHALQIDADGQHDTQAVSDFLRYATQYPRAVISGYPIYDQSVPKARLYARYLTHFWVGIHTLSRTRIRDSMCGLRVYPLAETIPVLAHMRTALRMEFDTEIIVRLDWRNTIIINRPVAVHYPQKGISNFRIWQDNLRISWMHIRLFFGMLIRLPTLYRKPKS